MNDYIYEVAFTSTNKVKKCINPIYQWDHDIRLCVSGLPSNKPIELHYAYKEQTDPAFVVVAEYENDSYSTEIPNELLTQPGEIRCYVYVDNDESGMTVYEIRIPVVARPMPSDYRYDPMNPNDIVTYEEIFTTLAKEDLILATYDEEGIVADEEGNIIEW